MRHSTHNIKKIRYAWSIPVVLMTAGAVILLISGFYGKTSNNATQNNAYYYELLSFITGFSAVIGGFNMFRLPFIKKKIQHTTPGKAVYLHTWCRLRSSLQTVIGFYCLIAACLSGSESCIWCSLCVAVATGMCLPSQSGYKEYLNIHLQSDK